MTVKVVQQAPMLKCRRCAGEIDTSARPAHLVRRREDDYPQGKPLATSIIVCDDCLRETERGWQEGSRETYVFVPRPGRLTYGQEKLLWELLDPDTRIYRMPKRVFAQSPADDQPRNVSHAAYDLIRNGYAMWDVIPERDRVIGGPTAWLLATHRAAEYYEKFKEVE